MNEIKFISEIRRLDLYTYDEMEIREEGKDVFGAGAEGGGGGG